MTDDRPGSGWTHTEPAWARVAVVAVWLVVLAIVVALSGRTCGPSSADVERQWAESVRRAGAEGE